MGLERKSRSFLDPQALARLARLPLLSRRPMQGNVSGQAYRAPIAGQASSLPNIASTCLATTCDGSIGEPSAEPIVTTLKNPKQIRTFGCCLVVDTSGSMAFGSSGITKIEFAKRIAGGLGLPGDSARRRSRTRRALPRASSPKFRRGAIRPTSCRCSICWNEFNRPAARSWCRCSTSWPKRFANAHLS